MRRRKKQYEAFTGNSGFTLVELLVVITIIGILAAILIPTLISARCDATAGGVQNKLSNIKSKLGMYKHDNGRYPPENEEAGSEPLVESLSEKKGPGSVYFEFEEDYLKDVEGGKKYFSQFANPGVLHEAYEIHYALPRGEHYQERWQYSGDNPSTDLFNLNEVNLWTAGCNYSVDGENKEAEYEINTFD